VATIAFDSTGARQAARQPVSAHPAFPAIVALWFAALLGLGSLVLPGVLLERALVATGVSSLIPAAGPPLGFTARGLIALAAAVMGALTGLAIARRVARAQADEPAPRFSSATGGVRRPISVHDELGGEGVVNGRGLPVTRRRALAITEDDRPSDFLYTAPLPGEVPADADSAPASRLTPYMADDEPLELHETVDEPAASEASALPEADAADTLTEDDPMIERQEFRRLPEIADDEPMADDAAPEPDEIEDAGPEPLPFTAPSLSRRLDHHLGAPPWQPLDIAADEEDDDEAESTAEPVPAPEAVTEPAEGRADWANAEPDALGLVQLVQRLGSSLERRRAWLAERPAVADAPAPAVPQEFEAAPAEEAAQAMAQYFGRSETPPASPVAPAEPPASEHAERASPGPPLLRPLAVVEDDDDHDDSLADFSLPLRRPVALAPVAAEPQADAADAEPEDEASHGDAGYSSLLAMGNPFAAARTEFVRIDEPEAEADAVEPTVVFPGSDAAAPAFVAPVSARTMPAPAAGYRLFDPPGNSPTLAAARPTADTDAALRAALATLQRMSGAA